MSILQPDTEELSDPPDGWHSGGGSRSSSYYDYWWYTDKTLYEDGEFGWECHIYWDSGQPHHVEFFQYTKMKPNGDFEYSYPDHHKSFETKPEAFEYAAEKASELR